MPIPSRLRRAESRSPLDVEPQLGIGCSTEHRPERAAILGTWPSPLAALPPADLMPTQRHVSSGGVLDVRRNGIGQLALGHRSRAVTW